MTFPGPIYGKIYNIHVPNRQPFSWYFPFINHPAIGVPPWLWKPPLSERGPPTGIAPRSSREAEAVPVMEPGGSVLRRDRVHWVRCLGGVQLGLLMGITISITMVYRWYIFNNITISGWWYTYPSEKYESQSEGLSHILWKQKNVWNHVTRYGKNFHKTRWHVTRTTMVNYNPLTNPSIRWCPWETLAKLV